MCIKLKVCSIAWERKFKKKIKKKQNYKGLPRVVKILSGSLDCQISEENCLTVLN